MSHPLSDPAVSAVAAMPRRVDGAPSLAGADSGDRLLGRAQPDSAGDALAGQPVCGHRSIGTVRSAGAGTRGGGRCEQHRNSMRWICATSSPAGEGFDFIIAHGFFSWVPDEVKSSVVHSCCANDLALDRRRDDQFQSRMRMAATSSGDRKSPRHPAGRGGG